MCAVTDTNEVSHDVFVKRGFLGDENTDLVLLAGVPEAPGHNAALTNTALVADDRASFVAQVVDSHSETVDLFSEEWLFLPFSLRVAEFVLDEVVQVAVLVD